ncbi:MAG: LIM domain-containing protein [Methanobacterium sp.]
MYLSLSTFILFENKVIHEKHFKCIKCKKNFKCKMFLKIEVYLNE